MFFDVPTHPNLCVNEHSEYVLGSAHPNMCVGPSFSLAQEHLYQSDQLSQVMSTEVTLLGWRQVG